MDTKVLEIAQRIKGLREISGDFCGGNGGCNRYLCGGVYSA